MKRILFVFLGAIGLLLLLNCKGSQVEVETHWSSDPIKVDGEIEEWNDIPKNYFEKSGVGLGLCNDTENLYVLFRLNNAQWARAIRMGGLTLWLDNSGKKNKDFGIRYTGGPTLPDLQKIGGPGGGFQESMTPEQQKRLAKMEMDMADQITVINKKSNQEIVLRADGSGGPAVSFASVQGVYTYEFSIPLQKSNVFDCAVNANPGQTICLGLEWGDMGDRQRMRQGMGDGMRKPPGGGGRGGMGGGPPGGGRGGSRMQPPEKQEVWLKTQLASPPEKQG